MAESAPTGGLFPRTRWTLIRSAQEDPAARAKALQELLAVYWRPLYVFVRRKGLSAEETEDAVQELFVMLLERDFLNRLDPERGKLRSFLMTAASNHLANRHEKAVAAKRGGGVAAVPLDAKGIESKLAEHPADAERAFQQEWAATLLEHALGRLKAEFKSGERRGPFDVVALYFGTDDPPPYRETAAKHKMTVPGLKAFLHRARLRFRELVKEEIAETVSDPAQAEEELRELLAGLG